MTRVLGVFLCLSFMVLASAVSLAADRQTSCRVSSVDEHENIWKERLGVYGGTDVDEDSQTVNFSWKSGKIDSIGVGQRSWSVRSDRITTREGAQGETIYEILQGEGDLRVRLIVYSSERGVVLTGNDASQWSKVASFDCSSVKQVLASSSTSKNVKKLSKSEYQRLGKTIRDRISDVDLALELGDGYYDLLESRTYVVFGTRSKETIGYILWGRLFYTEDNEEVEAEVIFDRNGLRLEGPNR